VIDVKKHQVTAENAAMFKDWLIARGGLAVWESQDFSRGGQSWTTPLNQADGTPTPRPHWSCREAPDRVVTDVAEVEVCVDKEVRRFRVAVRMGSQGMSLKLTDAATRKVREAVAKAGKGAYHRFDYETQEAVIFAPEKVVPLTEWEAK
jgi:hypothetical protein